MRGSDADAELVTRCVALERRTMRGYGGDDQSLRELFERPDNHLVRASCGDELVGFCLHSEVRALEPQPRPILANANPHPNPPQAKRIVFVSELHVDPAFRRRGAASTLLRMAGDAGLSPLSPVGEVRRIAIAHARSHAMIRS